MALSRELIQARQGMEELVGTRGKLQVVLSFDRDRVDYVTVNRGAFVVEEMDAQTYSDRRRRNGVRTDNAKDPDFEQNPWLEYLPGTTWRAGMLVVRRTVGYFVAPDEDYRHRPVQVDFSRSGAFTIDEHDGAASLPPYEVRDNQIFGAATVYTNHSRPFDAADESAFHDLWEQTRTALQEPVAMPTDGNRYLI